MSTKKGSGSGAGHDRSAVTGRYVTEQYAKTHPATTVHERTSPKPPPPSKPKGK